MARASDPVQAAFAVLCHLLYDLRHSVGSLSLSLPFSEMDNGYNSQGDCDYQIR